MNIVEISFKNLNNNIHIQDNKDSTSEECSAGTHVHFDHSHVLLSFLYPVKGGYGASHIYIQTITCCYPFKVPTLIKYSHCMLTFKPLFNFQQQIIQHNGYICAE